MRLFTFAVSAIAACSSSSSSGDPSIHASDYAQSCMQGSDCVTVSEGTVCGCNGCPNAAINKADEQRYSADYTRLHQQCTAPPGPCPGYQCANPQVACKAGICVLCNAVAGGCGTPDAGTSDASQDAQTD